MTTLFQTANFSFSNEKGGSAKKTQTITFPSDLANAYSAITSWKLSYSDKSDHKMTSALVETSTQVVSGDVVNVTVKVNWRDQNKDDKYDANVTVLVIGVTD